MPFDDHTPNFAYSLVATAPSPATTGTSLVVTAGQGALFPTPPFNATIWPASTQPLTTNAEIVRVTAISTDTLTIKRAQESSTVRTVGIGDQIAATVTAQTLTDVEAGFSPDLALTGMTSPRENVIPASMCAHVASDFEVGCRYGATNAAGTVTAAGDVLQVASVTLPTRVVLTAIYIDAGAGGFTTNGNVKGGIYADSAGAPGSLLYSIAPVAFLATDLLVRLATSSLEIGGTVWLAILPSTDMFLKQSTTESGSKNRSTGITYAGGMPNPFGTPDVSFNLILVSALAEYATEIGAGSLLEIT